MPNDHYKSLLDGVLSRANESLSYGVDKLDSIKAELDSHLRATYDEISYVRRVLETQEDSSASGESSRRLRQQRDDLERERVRCERFLTTTTNAAGRLRLAIELVNNRASNVVGMHSVEMFHDALQVLQFAENEYKRIAREIHDGPIQQFAAIILMFDYLERVIAMGDRDAIDRETTRIKRELKNALADFRGFLLHLQPSGLDVGLGLSIARFAENVRDRYGVECRALITHESDDFSSEMRTNIFRVVQEAVSNAVRHGGATELEIMYTYDDSTIEVSVEDNGKGFDLERAKERAAARSSHGLTNMAERIRVVGGRIDIDSAEERGTRIEMIIPIGGEQD